MEDQETILRRIQKLFALAGNNPNEAEVQAAMLKAQELLLQHNLSMETVNGFHEQEETEENVKEEKTNQGGKKLYAWHLLVARVIVKNFRCKHYIMNNYRNKEIRLIGLGKDVNAAKETLNFIYAVAPKLWLSFYSKWQDTPGNFTWNKKQTYALKNDYFMGFVEGLEAKFIEQVQNKELMIVVPNAVVQEYGKLHLGHSGSNWNFNGSGNQAARNQGYKDGKGATEKHKYIQ